MGRVGEECSNLLGVLNGTLRVLSNGLELSTLLLASLLDFYSDSVTLLSLLPEKDTRDLCCADAEQKEVDGSEARWIQSALDHTRISRTSRVNVQKVSGLNDEAPAGPDQTSSHEGTVLRERKRFDGTSEVGSTGKNETPLHDRSPEVDSLRTDGRRPELLKARLRRSWDCGIGVGCGRVCASLSDGLAGVGSLLAEGIEETETGSERHGCCLLV